MKKYNRPICLFQRIKMSKADYSVYQRDMREYRIVNNIPLRGIKLRKIIYPAVAFGVKLFRIANGHTIEVVSDRRTPSEKPVIFAVTHIGKFDIERVFEACGTSCWIFNGDPDTVYRNFDGFSLFFSGVILIDTDCKTDREVALKTAVKLLNSGGNLMFFPEGIWNVEPSIPVLPLYPGIAKIATETGAEIIPVAIEQYGKHFQIVFGSNISVDKYRQRIKEADKQCVYQELLQQLRDEMACLKWKIFELNHAKRKEIGNFDLYQKDRVNEKLSEWTNKNNEPYFSVQTLRNRQYNCKSSL